MERMEKIRFLATMAIVVGLYMAAVPAMTNTASADHSNFDYDAYGYYQVKWETIVNTNQVAARCYLYRYTAGINGYYLNMFTRLYQDKNAAETDHYHIKTGTTDGKCDDDGLPWAKDGVSNRYPMEDGSGYDRWGFDGNGLGRSTSHYVNMHNTNWRYSGRWGAWSAFNGGEKWNLHHKWASESWGDVETKDYAGSHQGATFKDPDCTQEEPYDNGEYWVIIEDWWISEDKWYGWGDKNTDQIWAFESIWEAE